MLRNLGHTADSKGPKHEVRKRSSLRIQWQGLPFLSDSFESSIRKIGDSKR